MTEVADPPPLAGIEVLDFTALVPGPFATLLLSEAGANVTRIERPDGGDAFRAYPPKIGDEAACFALLNRGKRSLFLDLKNAADNRTARTLAARADILVEQYRPGVMAGLGLDYDTLASDNPGLIYCSITGYGQQGERARTAGHDLNFLADTGMLSLVTHPDGCPALLPIPLADLAGGSYPAVFNIMLALRRRQTTGRGCHLDIAIADNLFALLFRSIGAVSAGEAVGANCDLLTGASDRYGVYRTRDGRYLAVAPLEPKFWAEFCAIAGIPPTADRRRIAAAVAAADAATWRARFRGRDVCCSVVQTIAEAMADPRFAERGLFDRALSVGGQRIAALPDGVAPNLRDPHKNPHAPAAPPAAP